MTQTNVTALTSEEETQETAATPAAAPAEGWPPIPRDANGRFLPGAPGRRPGSRNLLSAQVTRDLLKDFQADRDELLPRFKRWFLPQYMQMITRLAARGGDGEARDPAELVAALKQALAEAEAAAAQARSAAEAG